MARRGRGRKFRKYIKGNINESTGLSTLASQTGIKRAISSTVIDTTYCSSVKAMYSITDWVLASDAGPVVVYLAHSDYTLAEVEEYIEATGSWDRSDLRTEEIRRRKIRMVGSFQNAQGSTEASTIVMNGGRPVHTKCGWVLSEGKTIALIFYNAGAAALSTTPTVEVLGFANLWPQ